MVGETGLEPAPVLPDNDLNVARIPIPPLAHAIEIIPNDTYFFTISSA